ncbi:MAG: ABC transporter permease [Eubacteriales bacterium]|nr:ABC transporter permease [Eubacteriales bacterium]
MEKNRTRSFFKKILLVTARDVKVDLRQAMALYMLLAPFLLALILRAFIPAAGNTTLNTAIIKDADTALILYLEQYASVEKGLEDEDALKSRISKTDDIFGVIGEADGSFRIIEQGNETEGSRQLLEFLLAGYSSASLPGAGGAEIKISELGWKVSPLRQYGASFLVLFMSMIGGMLIALNLIEEKMYNTIAALNVAPIAKSHIVTGKAIPGFILPVIHGFGTLLILGYSSVDFAKVTVVLLSVAMISVIIGFTAGVTSSEPISGIASMKSVFIPIAASIFGAIFLNEKWHVLLFWSPYYWAFKSMDGILLQTAGWAEIIRNTTIILALACIVFILLGKKIRRGLA